MGVVFAVGVLETVKRRARKVLSQSRVTLVARILGESDLVMLGEVDFQRLSKEVDAIEVGVGVISSRGKGELDKGGIFSVVHDLDTQNIAINTKETVGKKGKRVNKGEKRKEKKRKKKEKERKKD